MHLFVAAVNVFLRKKYKKNEVLNHFIAYKKACLFKILIFIKTLKG